MSQSRTTTGILTIIVLAVIGYVLVTIPPRLFEGYHHAAEVGAWMGYAYLAVVGLGSLLLGGLLLAILLHVLKNTRQKAADHERRSLSPSQMSAGAQTQEIEDNLTKGREVAAEGRVSPEIQKEIAAAVDELAAKRQAQQLEIVAFGTISSGKSSLLNALAGRQMFRTNVVGGTTVSRSEIPWPAGDRVVLVDTPGLAEVRGESRAADAAAAAKNADLVLFVVDGPLKSYESELLEALSAMEKRIVVCLNKEDWYDA
jgi:small GTP-binding protein